MRERETGRHKCTCILNKFCTLKHKKRKKRSVVKYTDNAYYSLHSIALDTSWILSKIRNLKHDGESI